MSLRPLARSGCLAAALAFVSSCSSTRDSLGCSERDYRTISDGGINLAPLLGPASYPNLFSEMLGKSQSEITAKLTSTFEQLFHSSDAIYFTIGTDQAYIRDVLKEETRTEGIGLGMLIAVQLDKRDEFDRLWRYAKANQEAKRPAQGYFPSFCVAPGGEAACHDPYGYQQIATALLLARGRWQDSPGTLNYEQEASDLIDLARLKETYNCGIEDGITSVFDAKSLLPYNMPLADSAGISRPSIVMPAYYELWNQATGDEFWSKAAVAARAYWEDSAHPKTGLVPEQAAFDGTPVPPFDNFKPEGYRTFVNMALDRIWSGSLSGKSGSLSGTWIEDESNRVLQFFHGQGLTSYGQMYSLDGTEEIESVHDAALVAANGTLALVATDGIRAEFVNQVWNLVTPTGRTRYFPGIMQMVALLLLSGEMRVY
jgi:oligosaccharide reducing-end xylanase